MKSDGELKTYYVTKYALTQGILKVQGRISSVADTMMCFRWNGWETAVHGNDWHETLDAAQKHAESMRLKKLASVKKQLAKLEQLSVKVVDIEQERDSRKSSMPVRASEPV